MSQEFLQADAGSLARLHSKEAIGAVVEVLRDRTAFPGDRLKAAQILLDRGHGKPTSVTVAIPAKRAISAQLIGMTEADLLAIVAARQRAAPAAEPHEPEWVGGVLESEETIMARRFAEAKLVEPEYDDPTT